MTNIIRKDESTLLKGGKLSGSKTSFQNRVRSNVVDVSELPNRICLMLDCSSSMSTYEAKRSGDDSTRIELLKEAVENFIARCNFVDTAIAIETFPPSISVPLTNNLSVLQSSTFGLHASGNTPMHQCVSRSIEKLAMTRAVLVSDGEATDWKYFDKKEPQDDILTKYKDAKIPIDCVHISNDSGGETLLRRIAEATEGLFLKFTDVSAFASAFGYLTPGLRGMLTNGSVSANDLGAKEVR